MFHLAFIIFNIISQLKIFTIDILSCSAFITFILMSFCRYLPFDVLSFCHFLPFNTIPVDLLFHSTICPLTFFYCRFFLLRHFVFESTNPLLFPWDEIKFDKIKPIRYQITPSPIHTLTDYPLTSPNNCIYHIPSCWTNFIPFLNVLFTNIMMIQLYNYQKICWLDPPEILFW